MLVKRNNRHCLMNAVCIIFMLLSFVLAGCSASEKMTVEKIYRRNIYRNIMNDLTPEQKELYFLYFMEEKSSAEIASLMNEKNGTIRMRISRLRFSIINKVKDLLK